MPHDSLVAQQAFDVVLGKPGNAVGVEILEGSAKSLALTQDREPREAGLESLQAEALVDAALVADRPSPLVVVVGGVEGVAPAEAANVAQRSSNGRSRITIPSSTTTG
jgi:hypothetical protein